MNNSTTSTKTSPSHSGGTDGGGALSASGADGIAVGSNAGASGSVAAPGGGLFGGFAGGSNFAGSVGGIPDGFLLGGLLPTTSSSQHQQQPQRRGSNNLGSGSSTTAARETISLPSSTPLSIQQQQQQQQQQHFSHLNHYPHFNLNNVSRQRDATTTNTSRSSNSMVSNSNNAFFSMLNGGGDVGNLSYASSNNSIHNRNKTSSNNATEMGTAFDISDFPTLSGGGGLPEDSVASVTAFANITAGGVGSASSAFAMALGRSLSSSATSVIGSGGGNSNSISEGSNLYRLAMTGRSASTGVGTVVSSSNLGNAASAVVPNFNMATEDFPALPGSATSSSTVQPSSTMQHSQPHQTTRTSIVAGPGLGSGGVGGPSSFSFAGGSGVMGFGGLDPIGDVGMEGAALYRRSDLDSANRKEGLLGGRGSVFGGSAIGGSSLLGGGTNMSIGGGQSSLSVLHQSLRTPIGVGIASGGASGVARFPTSVSSSSSSLPGVRDGRGPSTTASGSSSVVGGGGGIGGGGAGAALSGDYGLLGLLGIIRMSDPDRNTLALGSDLTLLGLNLNATQDLYFTFVSPWVSNPSASSQPGDTLATSGQKSNSDRRSRTSRVEPAFHLPMCYYMTPPALKTGHLSKFQLETLFYIYYALPRDALQAYAAQELYERDWRYHVEFKLWFKRNATPDSIDGTAENGAEPHFIYFDVKTWERRLFNGAAAAAVAGRNYQNTNVAAGFLSEGEALVKQLANP